MDTMSQDMSHAATTIRLYWCTTGDHEEDWFVLARNAEEARDSFAEHHGYQPREVLTHCVTEPQPTTVQAFVAQSDSPNFPMIPDLDLLKGLGAELLSLRSPTAVRFGSSVFVEGSPDIE